MNYQELVTHVSGETGLPKKQVDRVFDTLRDAIHAELEYGESVSLPGVGKFVSVHRAERVGRNVRTGEPITIPAHNAPKFKPAKSLKEALR